MTPAINQAKKAKIPYTVHEYEHDPAAESYGREAAVKLGVEAGKVYKTLVVDGCKDLIVAVVPVMCQLDLKLLAKAAGAKKLVMADVRKVERTTGYVVGGVSPMGQKKRLMTFIDASAEEHSTMLVSAGRRGLEIELAPADLSAMTGGVFAPLAK
ncbi:MULTISPECIES: Cys-tRNA(Pro) deacylase [unclassified Pseudodesulfovibrio]|uniref:Cys-tRNA(Pro) deacylase n=1 Tax=unclassified Pseudodesulfovibrio TaxID=2661612 RepID=UPI000FEBE23E|nr:MULTISPECIES: Cys-tRNA(Pro) deacylase [unclassified Pseudodesulfovibrio]MCJ2163620.1 Cys-tRNA(Pro) deacylase [Pseudodesulfovibrio sp. S3-i]RWU06850.1 Cys-tRNA(Pro) deacylase [Pseudodesulfovibrio sp. S3]